MYSKTVIDRSNGTVAPTTPIQLIEADVPTSFILASRNEHDLPRVGVNAPEGFEVVKYVKIQLHTETPNVTELTLADARVWLRDSYESDPSLYYGIGNHGQNWGHLTAYRKLS